VLRCRSAKISFQIQSHFAVQLSSPLLDEGEGNYKTAHRQYRGVYSRKSARRFGSRPLARCRRNSARTITLNVSACAGRLVTVRVSETFVALNFVPLTQGFSCEAKRGMPTSVTWSLGKWAGKPYIRLYSLLTKLPAEASQQLFRARMEHGCLARQPLKRKRSYCSVPVEAFSLDRGSPRGGPSQGRVPAIAQFSPV
jgi:hypothetical protein